MPNRSPPGSLRSTRVVMNLPDEEIVERVLAGDRELFAILVERYQKPIYTLMYRQVRQVDHAADLSQEAFLKAFDRLWSFRPGNRFFPWLYALAVNLARDWQRKTRRSPELAGEWELDNLRTNSPQSGQLKLEQEERRRLVDQALASLPAETREMVIMRYRYECTIGQVAAAFSRTESATKMRIHRGLAQLQQYLTGTNDGTNTVNQRD